jgi:hypothetical protein
MHCSATRAKRPTLNCHTRKCERLHPRLVQAQIEARRHPASVLVSCARRPLSTAQHPNRQLLLRSASRTPNPGSSVLRAVGDKPRSHQERMGERKSQEAAVEVSTGRRDTSVPLGCAADAATCTIDAWTFNISPPHHQDLPQAPAVTGPATARRASPRDAGAFQTQESVTSSRGSCRWIASPTQIVRSYRLRRGPTRTQVRPSSPRTTGQTPATQNFLDTPCRFR